MLLLERGAVCVARNNPFNFGPVGCRDTEEGGISSYAYSGFRFWETGSFRLKRTAEDHLEMLT